MKALRNESGCGWLWLGLLLGLGMGLLWGVDGVAADVSTNRVVQFKEPGLTRYILEGAVESGVKPQPAEVGAAVKWRKARREGGGTYEIQLGNRIVLKLEPGMELEGLIQGTGLKLARTLRSGLYVLEAASSDAAMEIAQQLADRPGVLVSVPVMRRALKHHNKYGAAVNDTRFASQWNLENRKSDGSIKGPDLNIRAAWPWTRGEGVTVAVVDTGVQLDHPDLVDRVVEGLHYDFYRDVASGLPFSDAGNHGTAVAGLVAATGGNSRGVAGVAPLAGLASWVIFGEVDGGESVASDEQLMDMFRYATDRVWVQNHSWGSASVVQQGLSLIEDDAIEEAVTRGRGGKGVVLVRAAGNARRESVNANDDGYGADPRSIAVAAVRVDGRVCSYSNRGACVLVAAPSGDVVDTNDDGVADGSDPTAKGVYTTDRTGGLGYVTSTSETGSYYDDFNGTSASAPQIAGVVALALSVNTNLTVRDVQQILLLSARHYDLADPDVRTNGAGFRFSHNVGFGVPDAGVVVELARSWANRPALVRVAKTNASSSVIPDDALRVISSGSGLPSSLLNVRCLPSLGIHPDVATASLPLVDVGQANQALTVDLKGKAALIQRGTSLFSDKIRRAADAGAAFAVIYNNTGTTAIQAMGATEFVPIPAVSIGLTAGQGLKAFLATNKTSTTRIQLASATRQFNVADTLACEYVGVRLRTTHLSRQDVRVTLVSPMGTRSVLQFINADPSPGPVDWTYWTAAHFYESSAGTWRVEVSDERNTTYTTASGTTASATGSLIYCELIVTGTALTDSDRDGLDDGWEMAAFGNLGFGPKDDPDGDGYNNAREQVLRTRPNEDEREWISDLALWKAGYWRLSWPGVEGVNYEVATSAALGSPWTVLTNMAGTFPVSERVIRSATGQRYFKVTRKE